LSATLFHDSLCPLAEILHEATAQQLVDSIEQLSQQVEVLRNVADEIREELSWAVRNGHDSFERNGYEPCDDCVALSIDRISDAPGLSPHHFTVRHHEPVHVFIADEQMQPGEVTGLSQATDQVRVRLVDEADDQWFLADHVFPQSETWSFSGHSSLTHCRFGDSRIS